MEWNRQRQEQIPGPDQWEQYALTPALVHTTHLFLAFRLLACNNYSDLHGNSLRHRFCLLSTEENGQYEHTHSTLFKQIGFGFDVGQHHIYRFTYLRHSISTDSVHESAGIGSLDLKLGKRSQIDYADPVVHHVHLPQYRVVPVGSPEGWFVSGIVTG